ncbi:uncharacterized protein EHS24_004104 [Apiotrichum porosum]|uniref:Uncharacterized protein n=1 Tax=Apiotrichum porosum TaxID=105984 RepID=A0A427Y4A9_9TREE|nr:uncharacterized protein EHS24_004104 [Apiotrichum porosum]RSH85919.1 hypothetical protein EHS24_004104 [Apiotrichum porosum]
MASALQSDLDALSSLPSSVLQKLIDPTSQPPPASPSAADQLRALDPAKTNVEASVSLSRAYVSEMKTHAFELEPAQIGATGEDYDGKRVEAIRASAEQVKAAVDEYATMARPIPGDK